MLEITQLYLKKDQKTMLKRIASQRSKQIGKPVSMAELVRESIDLFLAGLPRDAKQDHVASVQEDDGPNQLQLKFKGLGE